MESTCTYHQTNVPTREENVCFNVLAVEMTIASSSRFPTIGCFFCAVSISNRNDKSLKDSRVYSSTVSNSNHSNTIFLLLDRTRVFFHLPITLIRNNIIWKYMMKNVMESPYFNVSSSAFCIVQDKDIENHIYTIVRYKKLLWIKCKFISAIDLFQPFIKKG